MINLDDPLVYKQYDTQDMLGRIRELPRQCEGAWQLVSGFPVPSDFADANEIIILGMGGSAIGGDLVRTYVSAECEVPIVVWRDYDGPQFMDVNSLVIACSYSGNTEETLSGFAQAVKLGAQAIAVTTGGALKEMAERAAAPVLEFNYKAQPRAALGYSFIPLIGIFQKLGYISDKASEVNETVQVLSDVVKDMDIGVPTSSNPAKQLAITLFERLPVIYGAGFLSEVARRWKTQVNENSKSWAFHEVLPELNHNAVLGYSLPAEIAKAAFVVMLMSSTLHPRVLLRYRITEEILGKAGVEFQRVESKGLSALAQMMSTILTGDFVSYYLAILNGTDPTPVEIINYLKQELAKS